MNVIWFLIITNWNGGVIALPQPGLELCLKNAGYIANVNFDKGRTDAAYCIQGGK